MCVLNSIAQKMSDVKSAEKSARLCAFSVIAFGLSFFQRDDLNLADRVAVHAVDAEDRLADGQFFAFGHRALQTPQLTLRNLADGRADIRQVNVQQILNVADARVGSKGGAVPRLCGIKVQKFAHGKDCSNRQHAEQQIKTAERSVRDDALCNNEQNDFQHTVRRVRACQLTVKTGKKETRLYNISKQFYVNITK